MLILKNVLEYLKRCFRSLHKGEVIQEKPIPTLYGRNLMYAQLVKRENGRKMVVLKIGQGETVTDVWLDKSGAKKLLEFLKHQTID